jgi:hypothetical protein
MAPGNENASNEDEELRVGDVAQLRVPHGRFETGTRGRVIGFYTAEPREALLALDDGEELRVLALNLERVR